MTDSSIRWLGAAPEQDEPVLIVMLTGWIDAGGAAAEAMAAIREEAAAATFLAFDDDTYIDFRARRPVMELRDGINTVMQWSTITMAAGHDRAGHDLVLLSGPEPDMAWHRFAAAVGDLAVDLRVRRMVALGAYPFTTPHTRPSRLSCTTPSPDVLASVPFLRSSIDVPAGMAAVLEHALHERGIPALGIWAQVPHYVSAMSYPPATVTLLDGLRDAADVVVDATAVRQAAIELGQRLDSMVAENAEHQRMLGQLEDLYDSLEDDLDTRQHGPSLEMRSGDELAAELERFLRDRDQG
ncbi:MAG TPA: PAC2 family protein [Ilumatobacteraceae bacterium]